MNRRSHYTILKLNPNSTQTEIEEAYQKRSDLYHSLASSGDEDYIAAVRLIEQAYRVLSDPEKRKKYDEELGFEKQQEIIEYQKRVESHYPDLSPAWKKTRFFVWWHVLLFFFSGLVFGLINYHIEPPGEIFNLVLFTLVITLIGLGGTVKNRNRTGVIKTAIWGVSMLSLNIIMYFKFQKQEFYIDNQTDSQIYVTANDQFLAELPSNEYAIVSIRPGTYVFKAYQSSNDSLVETFENTIYARKRILYNILSAGHYVEGDQKYALNPFGNGGSNLTTNVDGRWIWIHHNYVFEDLPDEVTARLPSTSKTVSFLKRR